MFVLMDWEFLFVTQFAFIGLLQALDQREWSQNAGDGRDLGEKKGLENRPVLSPWLCLVFFVCPLFPSSPLTGRPERLGPYMYMYVTVIWMEDGEIESAPLKRVVYHMYTEQHLKWIMRVTLHFDVNIFTNSIEHLHQLEKYHLAG